MQLQKLIAISNILRLLVTNQPHQATYNLLVEHGVVRDLLDLLQKSTQQPQQPTGIFEPFSAVPA
jgi:hypothetical protein